MTDQLEVLATIQSHLASERDRIDKKEVAKAFNLLIEAITEVRAYCENLFNEGVSKQKQTSKTLEEQNKALDGLTKELKETEKGLKNNLNSTEAELAKKINEVVQMVKTLPQFNPKPLEEKIKDVEDKIPTIPKEITPGEIRDKLEKLKGDDRLDKSAIRGLEDIIKEINDRISSIPRGSGGTGRTGGAYTYKLNALLDGSTKSFTIPKMREVTAVMGSSFPHTFASTDDYTVSGNVLTFTSAIDATTTLAAGQTIIVFYNSLFNL